MPGNSAIDIPPIVNDFVKENQATALYNLLSPEGEGYKKLQSIAEKISTELKTNLTDNSRKSRLSISNNSKGLIEIGMCLNFISQFDKTSTTFTNATKNFEFTFKDLEKVDTEQWNKFLLSIFKTIKQQQEKAQNTPNPTKQLILEWEKIVLPKIESILKKPFDPEDNPPKEKRKNPADTQARNLANPQIARSIIRTREASTSTDALNNNGNQGTEPQVSITYNSINTDESEKLKLELEAAKKLINDLNKTKDILIERNEKLNGFRKELNEAQEKKVEGYRELINERDKKISSLNSEVNTLKNVGPKKDNFTYVKDKIDALLLKRQALEKLQSENIDLRNQLVGEKQSSEAEQKKNKDLQNEFLNYTELSEASIKAAEEKVKHYSAEMETLEKNAKKYEEDFMHSANIKAIEKVQVTLKEAETLENKAAKLLDNPTEPFDLFSESLPQLQSDYDDLIERIDELNADLSKKLGTISDLEKMLAEKDRGLADKEKLLQEQKYKIVALGDQLAAEKKQSQESVAFKKTITNELTEHQQEITQQKGKYDEASKALQTEQAKNQTLTKELASKKSIINTLQEKIDKSSSDREKESLDSATTIKDKDKVLDQLKKQLEEEKKKLDALSKEKSESDKNITTLKNEVENFQTKNNDLKSDLGKKSKELDKLKTESLEIKQQLQNEKNKSGDLQSQIEEATTLKRQQEETLEKEKQKFIKAQKETAELQTKKEQLEQQLVEAKDLQKTLETSKLNIDELKNQKENLAFELSNDKKTHEQEKSLLEKKISDLETKIKEKSDELLTLKTSNNESIVALQKEIQKKESKIEEIQNKNGKTVEGLEASIDSKQTSIEEHVKKINELEKSYDDLQAEHQHTLEDLKTQLTEEKTKALEESNTHQQEIIQQEEKYKELSNKADDKTKEFEEIRGNFNKKTEEITQLQKEKTEMENKLKTSQAEETRLKDELNNLEAANNELNKQSEGNKAALDDLQGKSVETIQKLQSALMQQTEKTTEAEANLAQLEKQLEKEEGEKKRIQQEIDVQSKKLLESENRLEKSNDELQKFIKNKSRLTTEAIATQTEPSDATSDDKLPNHNSTPIENNTSPALPNVLITRTQSAPDLSISSTELPHDDARGTANAKAFDTTDSSSQLLSKESQDEDNEFSQENSLQNQPSTHSNSLQSLVQSDSSNRSERGSGMSPEKQAENLLENSDFKEKLLPPLAKCVSSWLLKEVTETVPKENRLKPVIYLSMQDSSETYSVEFAKKIPTRNPELQEALTKVISKDPALSENDEKAADQLSKELINNLKDYTEFQTNLIKLREDFIEEVSKVENTIKDSLIKFTTEKLENIATTAQLSRASFSKEQLQTEDKEKLKEMSKNLVTHLLKDSDFLSEIIQNSPRSQEESIGYAKQQIPNYFNLYYEDEKVNFRETAKNIGEIAAQKIQPNVNSERSSSSETLSSNAANHPTDGGRDDAGYASATDDEISSSGHSTSPNDNHTAEDLKAELLAFSQGKKEFHELPIPLQALQYASLRPEEFSLALQAVCSMDKEEANSFNIPSTNPFAPVNSFESLRYKLREKAFETITKADAISSRQDIRDLDAKSWLERKLVEITHRVTNIELTKEEKSKIAEKIKEKLPFSKLYLSAITLKSLDKLESEIENLKKYELKLIAQTYQEFSKIESKLSQYPTLLKESDDDASSVVSGDSGIEEESDLQHFTATLNEKLSHNPEITERQASILIDAISKHIKIPYCEWITLNIDPKLINAIIADLNFENEAENDPTSKIKLTSIAIGLLDKNHHLKKTLEDRKEWRKKIKQSYVKAEEISHLRVDVKNRVTLLKEMHAEKIAHASEDKSTLGQPGPIYLPNYCKVIEEDTALAQQDVNFTVTGGIFHRRDTLEKNVPVTYEQDLGDKKQLWSVVRTSNDALAYKTKGESKWNWKNVTQKEVAFTQMVDAVQSFKGNRVIAFNFNNCSKETERRYRIFIHAYNELRTDDNPLLYCLSNKKITMKTEELEQAKAEVKKQLNLHHEEVDANIKKMAPDSVADITPRLRARG